MWKFEIERFYMFLTTEPILQGKRYNAIRIIHATKSGKSGDKGYDQAVEEALSKLASRGTDLQADGVIGVHISTSVWSDWCQITVMGTAIKFF
jgi:uncharacterized protein YbjQ (UPF0145 family)